MYKLTYKTPNGDVELKLIGKYQTKKSSREVTFNSISVDFTGYSIESLPYKYQEVQLKNNNKIQFTGYVNKFKLPSMKLEDEDRELEIELLSPMAMATHRTFNAIGTFRLKRLVEIIAQPLIDDGFVLKEVNIADHQVTTNFLTATCEDGFNKISNKYNIFWYIDESKNIYINDISYLMNSKPKVVYNNRWDGLFKIEPSIEATDYYNEINFTNFRMYSISNSDSNYPISYPLISNNLKIKNGDEVYFEYPVDINPKNIKRVSDELSGSQSRYFTNVGLGFTGHDSNRNDKSFKIYVDGETLVVPNNVQIGNSNSETQKDFELILDSFFTNLVKGFRYNGSTTITEISGIYSCTALPWTRLKIIHNKEIERMKGIISDTGIVEKTIDLKEQWHTYNEMLEIAKSYLKINRTKVDKVNLGIDKDYNLFPGDLIRINKPNFYINDDFIITDITESIDFNEEIEYNISVRNANYFDNFIDLFRKTETQEIEEKTYVLTTSQYEESNIYEEHEEIL